MRKYNLDIILYTNMRKSNLDIILYTSMRKYNLDIILCTSMRKSNLIENILDIQNIYFLHSSLIKKLLLKTCNLPYLDVGGNVNIYL